MIAFSAGLLVSLVWDADGDPGTDNLPQIVVPLAARSAVDDAEALSEVARRDNGMPERSRGFGRLRRRTIIGREWRWRLLAVPERGP